MNRMDRYVKLRRDRNIKAARQASRSNLMGELRAICKNQLGKKPRFKSSPVGDNCMIIVSVGETILGDGTAASEKTAKKIAIQQALRFLQHQSRG